jgi:hypothetical protein
LVLRTAQQIVELVSTTLAKAVKENIAAGLPGERVEPV